MRSNKFDGIARAALAAVIMVSLNVLLAGCVAHLPLAQQSPDLPYAAKRAVAVAVLDERDVLAEGKAPNFIGRAHVSFGIPTDITVYPWYESDKSKKDHTLATALEERIVAGLNDEGWQLSAAGLAKQPTPDEVAVLLGSLGAERLLVLTLKKWFISLNLNWVSAFNFDWAYNMRIYDSAGIQLVDLSDAGRDVVDEQANQSPANHIRLAYRARLIKILERPEVRAALQD